MSLDKKIKKSQSEWMKGKGPMGDVVISTRLRLARNLADFPFPGRAEPGDLKEVRNRVEKVLEKLNYGLKILDLKEIPQLERKTLVERHLMSMNHAEDGPEKVLAVDEFEMISIMINEEDHMRIQVLFPGMQLEDGLRLINEIDDAIEEELVIAFNEKFGYLTSCPTNVGTGLRASVMVHLPGLKLAGRLGQTLQLISRLGMVVRGMYGEGSESQGDIFQISNQVTLGASEGETVENMVGIISKVVEQERQARQYLLKNREDEIRDQVQRAYGLLSHAYRMNTEEALGLLSDLKLGIELDLIKEVEPSILSQLMVLIRPAMLQRIMGQELESGLRDVKRAELIRKKLSGGESHVR